MQLDLFEDSGDVTLRNEVIDALRSRDQTAARKWLAMLAAAYPSDDLLKPLAALVDALASPPARPRTVEEASRALAPVENEVEPAALRVFGIKEGPTWLAPLWRSLAESVAGLAFSTETPGVHAAALLLRARDWEAADAAVASIPSWRRIPIPLAWMAEARFGQLGLAPAWPLLAELAWLDPRRFEDLAQRLEAKALRKLLRDFDTGFEADGDPDFAWFPAWILIVEPDLAPLLRETQSSRNTAQERAARIILQILSLERQGRHGEIVQHRKKLRDLNGALFERYMRTREG